MRAIDAGACASYPFSRIYEESIVQFKIALNWWFPKQKLSSNDESLDVERSNGNTLPETRKEGEKKNYE